jgi:hypothetical protein
VRNNSSSTSNSFLPNGSNTGVFSPKKCISKCWLKTLRVSSTSQPPTESFGTQQPSLILPRHRQIDAHVLPLLLRHASSIAQQLKDSADHDAVDLLRLVKRAVNWKLDTLVWWRDELHATLASRDDREPQLEVVVVVVRDDHLVEQVELFDAGHELIDRLGLDRVLLICNSVCARAGKSVLA